MRVTAKPTGRLRGKRGTDFYSGVLRAQPQVVDVYDRAGGLGDIGGFGLAAVRRGAARAAQMKMWGFGDLSGQTGIPAIDGILDSAGLKLEEVATAMKIEMALSAAALAVSLLLLYRSLR